MSWAGLDAEAVRARNLEATLKRPTLGASMVGGIVGFGGAALVVFGSVALAEGALHQALGTAGSYVLWTILFMVLGGGFLGRLVAGRGSLWRFVGVFSVGFALYGAGWCTGWFVWKWGWGEILGTVLGAALLHGVLVSAFGQGRLFFSLLPVWLVANLAGYFLGEAAWFALKRSPVGMSVWGLIYGVCLGAGLGWLLHRLQRPVAGDGAPSPD
jgi:hypothetical protein